MAAIGSEWQLTKWHRWTVTHFLFPPAVKHFPWVWIHILVPIFSRWCSALWTRGENDLPKIKQRPNTLSLSKQWQKLLRAEHCVQRIVTHDMLCAQIYFSFLILWVANLCPKQSMVTDLESVWSIFPEFRSRRDPVLRLGETWMPKASL